MLILRVFIAEVIPIFVHRTIAVEACINELNGGNKLFERIRPIRPFFILLINRELMFSYWICLI